MEPSSAGAVRAAMERLGWGVRDLYVATFAYGSVGSEHDLGLHVASGNYLGPLERAVVEATLNDALLDRGDSFPVAPA